MGGARPERYRGTAVQWVSGPGLCTSDLVLPRAQPATCGIHPQRNDGSRAGRICGRLVAGRGPALAGLDSGLPDGGSDCLCTVAQQENISRLIAICSYIRRIQLSNLKFTRSSGAVIAAAKNVAHRPGTLRLPRGAPRQPAAHLSTAVFLVRWSQHWQCD